MKCLLNEPKETSLLENLIKKIVIYGGIISSSLYIGFLVGTTYSKLYNPCEQKTILPLVIGLIPEIERKLTSDVKNSKGYCFVCDDYVTVSADVFTRSGDYQFRCGATAPNSIEFIGVSNKLDNKNSNGEVK